MAGVFYHVCLGYAYWAVDVEVVVPVPCPLCGILVPVGRI
jgi:hypothetical protein